jgi:hypothetical protein
VKRESADGQIQKKENGKGEEKNVSIWIAMIHPNKKCARECKQCAHMPIGTRQRGNGKKNAVVKIILGQKQGNEKGK